MQKFYLGHEQPASRLKSADHSIKCIGHLLPAIFYVGLKAYGMLPSIILDGTRVIGCTAGFTCIPGPQQAGYVGTHRLDSVFSNFPLGPGDEGNTLFFKSYCYENHQILLAGLWLKRRPNVRCAIHGLIRFYTFLLQIVTEVVQ